MISMKEYSSRGRRQPDACKTDYIDLYQLHWPSRNAPIFGQKGIQPRTGTQVSCDRSHFDALTL